jgi:hypothetical protein
MEIVGLLFAVVFLYALYHVIRVAVRDGMRDALKSQDIHTKDNDTER